MRGLQGAVVLLVLATGAFSRPPTKDSSLHLIKTSEAGPAEWMTQSGVEDLIRNSVHFKDITDHPNTPVRNTLIPAPKELPTSLRYQSIVNGVFEKLSIPRMDSFIATFSEFYTRYYTSESGIASSEWLLQEVSASIAAAEYGGVATVRAFEHSWPQTSVIARLEGSDPTLKSEVIVLGAHCDSVNLFNPSGGRSPGADDDASGSVVLIETFRALLESGFIPKRSVEFQWYAAEEVGLRGSQDIAAQYSDEGVNVVAMAQFDVVAYFNGRREIGIVTDYTDGGLNEFMRLVIDGYLSYTWTDMECGYSCSDHASWTQYGYPSTFPVEIVFHPQMHTPQDTIETVNFEQVLEFTKLAVGYAIEIAEPALE